MSYPSKGCNRKPRMQLLKSIIHSGLDYKEKGGPEKYSKHTHKNFLGVKNKNLFHISRSRYISISIPIPSSQRG